MSVEDREGCLEVLLDHLLWWVILSSPCIPEWQSSSSSCRAEDVSLEKSQKREVERSRCFPFGCSQVILIFSINSVSNVVTFLLLRRRCLAKETSSIPAAFILSSHLRRRLLLSSSFSCLNKSKRSSLSFPSFFFLFSLPFYSAPPFLVSRTDSSSCPLLFLVLWDGHLSRILTDWVAWTRISPSSFRTS